MGFSRENSFILALLTLAFIVGEISHFMLGVLSREMARDIHYGDFACFKQSNKSMRNGMNNTECDQFTDGGRENCENHLGCEFLENGQGIEYQILAGPTFVVVFTVSGIIMGYLADKVPR
jgi:hypothetical protein